MFSVSSGGVDMAKNTLAPHTNITIAIRDGMTIHPTSSTTPPAMDEPTLFGERRRYFTAKYTTRLAINTEKNDDTASTKKYSRSTRLAIVEAPAGKSGVPLHMCR